MENAITDLLDALIPNLEKLLGNIRSWMGVAMLIGPVIFIIMGLVYFFLAPPEANHKLGYRTYFGMGSVNAWKYTQKLAGIVWGGLGIVLAVVAIVGCVIMVGQELPNATSTALTILIIEAVGAVLAFFTVEIAVLMRYDVNGSLRKKKKKA